MQIFGLQYLKQKEHKVKTSNLFLLPHTTVERKSLKLGMHLNLKAASLRLSRNHLISVLITQRTQLCTTKDIYAWRQLYTEISNEMKQGKPSQWSQKNFIIAEKFHWASFKSLSHKCDTLPYLLLVSFQSMHCTSPHISVTSPRPLLHYFYHRN